MTRGRRKDLTIPPSRALLQQRDYRARKARYVAELEDRVQRTEQENSRLREELDVLRNRLHSPQPPQPHKHGTSPDVAAASTELMQHLTVAAASLARFQQLALAPDPTSRPPHQINPNTPISLATPSFTPSPVPPPHPRLPSPRHIEHTQLVVPYHHREQPQYTTLPPLGRIMGPAHFPYPPPDRPRFYHDHRAPPDDDDDDDELDDDDDRYSQAHLTQRMSDMRSTTSSSGSGPDDAGPSRLPGSLGNDTLPNDR